MSDPTTNINEDVESKNQGDSDMTAQPNRSHLSLSQLFTVIRVHKRDFEWISIPTEPDDILLSLMICIAENRFDIYNYLYNNIDKNDLNSTMLNIISPPEDLYTNILEDYVLILYV